MAGDKRIVLAFLRIRESADAFVSSQGGESVASTGNNFVSVSLMAHVPNDTIVRSIEYAMQSHGKLHRSQACAQMSRIFG